MSKLDFDFDAEPEDAWDAGDPLPVLLDNLARRVRLVLVALRLRAVASEKVRHRVELIVEDLEMLAARRG